MTPEIGFQQEIGPEPILTAKQEKILRFVSDFQEEHGYSPSIRQIVAGAEISSTSVVAFNLNRLEEKGCLTRDPNIARAIVLTDKAKDFLPAQVLPNNKATENPIENAGEN